MKNFKNVGYPKRTSSSTTSPRSCLVISFILTEEHIQGWSSKVFIYIYGRYLGSIQEEAVPLACSDCCFTFRSMLFLWFWRLLRSLRSSGMTLTCLLSWMTCSCRSEFVCTTSSTFLCRLTLSSFSLFISSFRVSTSFSWSCLWISMLFSAILPTINSSIELNKLDKLSQNLLKVKQVFAWCCRWGGMHIFMTYFLSLAS